MKYGMTLIQGLYFYKMVVSNHLDLDELADVPLEIPEETFQEWLVSQDLVEDYKEWLDHIGFQDNTEY